MKNRVTSSLDYCSTLCRIIESHIPETKGSSRFFENGIFNKLLGDIVREKLDFFERLYFNKCGGLINKALKTAKKGDLNSSVQAFKELDELLQSIEFSQTGKVLVKSYYGACFAYLMYKKGAFETAHELTLQVISLDAELVDDFPVLLMHQVQQINNLMRIEVKQGNYQSSLRIGCGLLLFLCDQVSKQKEIRLINRNLLIHVPFDLVEGMFYQIISEMAVTVLSLDSVKIWDLLETNEINSNSIEGFRLFSFGYSWIELQLLKEQRDNLAFLDKSFENLMLKDQHPVLWYAILYDALTRIDETTLSVVPLHRLKESVEASRLVHLW